MTEASGEDGKWRRWEVVTKGSGELWGGSRSTKPCVRSSMRFLKLLLPIALEWLHECCMGFVLGRKPEHETLYFSV